jgi:hypothetical protein
MAMYVESKPDFPPAPHDRHRAIGHVEKITRQQRRAAVAEARQRGRKEDE